MRGFVSDRGRASGRSLRETSQINSRAAPAEGPVTARHLLTHLRRGWVRTCYAALSLFRINS